MIPWFISEPDPSIYLDCDYIVVDFETTNLDKGDAMNPRNSVVLASWWYRGKMKSIVGSEYRMEKLVQDVEEAEVVVAHNAKFDMKWLQRCGADISKILFFDTMLAEYVLWANHPDRGGLGLGDIAKKYGYGTKDPYIDVMFKQGVCPSKLPRTLVKHRCEKDVQQTRKIFLKQRELLNQQNKLGVLYTKCIFTPVLADIESQGLYLNKERVLEEYDRATKALTEVTKELEELTGGINPKSWPQVAEFIYGKLGFKELTDRKGNPIRGKKSTRFPNGAPKTDDKTVAKLKATTKEQKKFLELKKRFSVEYQAISTYLDFFRAVVLERGGRFFGEFNQAITGTQRLSSSGKKISSSFFPKKKGPQLQNIPRIYKKLFRTRDEQYSYCEADGSQLEFRVAGHVGRDKQAIQDIIDKHDVHRHSASIIFNKLAEDVTKDERTAAKAHTFKPLYGGVSGTKREVEYYDAFKKRYPDIANTQAGWTAHVVNTKSLVTETGLEFFWPDTTMSPGGYIKNQQNIYNYPIQYLATGEIIPIAITKLWHELNYHGCKSKIVNTIHDSSPMELFKGEEKQVKTFIIDAYTNYVYFYLDRVYNIQFIAPLGVAIKIGEHWSEGDEEETQVNPPTRLEGVNYLVENKQ